MNYLFCRNRLNWMLKKWSYCITFCALLHSLICTVGLEQNSKKEWVFDIQWYNFLRSRIIFYVLQFFQMKSVAVAVYEVDWTFSTPAEVKSLTLMILIAQRGSTISYKGLCSLSNETFGWVRKYFRKINNEYNCIISRLNIEKAL